MQNDRRLILVTGTPRSGTTAVGQMLTLAPGAGALHEPFNYHSGLRHIGRYFEIPGSQAFPMTQLDQTVEQIRKLNLAFKPGIFPTDQGWRRAVKYIVGARPLNSFRRLRWHPRLRAIIWKDPLACFAADRAAKQHGVEVLVTLRNPYAVAGSFKRMEWAFDLSDLAARLQQAGLDSNDKLALLQKSFHTSVTNGVVLWSVVYSTLARWAQSNPRIRMVNLDDVVSDPVATYARLYKLLALDWSERIAAKISVYYRSESERSVPKEKKAHDHARNVTEVNTYWRGFLTEAEKAFVKEVAETQWSEFQKICV
jgi:hypothetical protein